jgi:hypothetical protein
MIRQMYYGLGSVPVGMRTTMPIMLGMWHNFKMAHLLIYRLFASTVFAPLFHHMVGGQAYVRPKKLSKMQIVFTRLRLAWPMVKQHFKDVKADPRTQLHQADLLQQVQDLCKFFIPAVSHNT